MNKVAIVTGAAKGIGRAIALRLAEDGMNIAINYRSNDVEANNLVDEINKLGVRAIAIKADISDFAQAEGLIKDTLKVFGRIDVIVNNAGVTKDSLLLRMTEESFDSVIEINLKGTFNCIKHVTPVMLKQKKGKIINISSVVGITGNAGQVNYSASKAGVIAMTKSLAKEVGSRGICVNAVAPGFIKTDMTAKLSLKAVEELSKAIALKRLGLPEDVAKAVSFLASDDSDYITGQVLCVDGGMVM
ncbi:3-oxoacyl-[acyl-carrier-protein] reductase [Clostridium amylolyticum]|uniref:3-oxoacyl-[acyl-carrier-protein] reductase n=1 Tax=Clostridium amylolyticum TaxID=1121298 RepID=A0A1M6CYD6_9CLOT|nr:3-oxoacyl-[acyl-carrier-protein] reductase [Clostridium amylolyticum]SHI65980.1 3-oxoacyl-[acyl-carrier-protein] reductase [Clostridium amylolyticum]